MLPTFFQIAPTTFNEFGIYYFFFALFIGLGFVMLGIILLAEPDPQYDIDSLRDIMDSEIPVEKSVEK